MSRKNLKYSEIWETFYTEKIDFLKDYFGKCDQILRKLRI